jgi:hypothetical protein
MSNTDSDTENEINFDYNFMEIDENLTPKQDDDPTINVISIPKRRPGRPSGRKPPKRVPVEQRTESQLKNLERARTVHTMKKLERIKQREDEIRELAETKIRLDNMNIQIDVEKKVEELLEEKRLQQLKIEEEERIKKLPVYKHTWIDSKGHIWKF